MNEMPTMPNPTTTIRFLLVSLGISPFASNPSTVSGSLLASASFHSLFDIFVVDDDSSYHSAPNSGDKLYDCLTAGVSVAEKAYNGTMRTA